MRRWRFLAVVAFAGVAIAAGATALAARSSHADPRKAAKALERSLNGSEAKVVRRNGALWVGISKENEHNHERFLVYRWSGDAWSRVADVRWRGWGNGPWSKAVSLTGSRDPDFAVQGCGAADTNCLSVVSDIGGRWHVVPFEYGEGRATVVNGIPQGHFVLTEVDACGCAGGPSTWMYERYANGIFRPADGPGKPPRCSRIDLEPAAGVGTVATLQFDRVACAGSWALAAGTGAGYDGPVVGLFDRSFTRGGRLGPWKLISLDNGLSLPTAPEIYDLPPALLLGLERKLGRSFDSIVRATRLIGRLRHGHRGIEAIGFVRAKDVSWLVEVDHPRGAPFSAEIYRWEGGRWAVTGRISNDHRLQNFGWGWFVVVRSSDGVAFGFATSSGPNLAPAPPGRFVITNAGGRWHVAPRR